MSNPEAAEPALPDADRLVAAIVARDATEPGYAVAIVRALAAKLDILKPAPAPPANGVDVRALIG